MIFGLSSPVGGAEVTDEGPIIYIGLHVGGLAALRITRFKLTTGNGGVSPTFVFFGGGSEANAEGVRPSREVREHAPLGKFLES